MDSYAVILIIVGTVAVSFFWLFPLGLWVAALASGAKVGVFELMAMRLRRVPPEKIVNPCIAAAKVGLNLPASILESHYLAGGDVERVVNALIRAEKAGATLSFEQAAAIDLSGDDPSEAVMLPLRPPR